jgi:hypothetical protein
MVLAILGASFVLVLSFAGHAAEGQPQGHSEIVFLC